MNLGFMKKVSFRTALKINEELIQRITEKINRDIDAAYTADRDQNGFRLNPKSGSILARNSFLPIVTGESSHGEQVAGINITCRQTKFASWILIIFGAFAAVAQIVCIKSAFENGFNVIPLFLPAILCTVFFLMNFVGYAVYSRKIIKIIEKILAYA